VLSGETGDEMTEWLSCWVKPGRNGADRNEKSWRALVRRQHDTPRVAAVLHALGVVVALAVLEAGLVVVTEAV
jgi:hypothetical protein